MSTGQQALFAFVDSLTHVHVALRAILNRLAQHCQLKLWTSGPTRASAASADSALGGWLRRQQKTHIGSI